MKKIQAQLIGETISSNNAEAFEIYQKSRFGEKKSEKINYMLEEAFFLIEKDKLEIIFKNKTLEKKEVLKKFQKINKRFHLKYPVYKDLREKGYIIKTALKFGADFRVYDKGKKPGTTHAKWIVFVDSERKNITWNEFSAKNRVAHSTKKKLLLAIVDDEEDVTYYEIEWIKP